MFNLIVSGRVNGDHRGFILAERVLSFTEEAVRARFVKDGDIDFQSLMAFPTLLMEEGRGDEVVRIAQLIRVTRTDGDYQLDYKIDPSLPRWTNADIFELVTELDMEKREFGTNHWAIKDVDLFEVLLRKTAMKRPAASVFQLSTEPVNPRLVSFMMPFSESFTSVYQGLKGVLEAEGFQCQRADDMWVHSHIMTDIVELICTSAVIICDLSTKNPNVFYEAGIAHTLGKEVILITQSHDDVPFDLKPIRYLHYLNNREGLTILGAEVLSRVRSVTRLLTAP